MRGLTRVSSTDFSKEVGRYQDLALTQPVVVTRNGRDRTVMISAEEYGRLKQPRGPAANGARGRERKQLDTETKRAAASFVERIKQSCRPTAVLVYGSRARGTHLPESDADIAVILKGEPRSRYDVLRPLADAA